jgi:hypothetical protein
VIANDGSGCPFSRHHADCAFIVGEWTAGAMLSLNPDLHVHWPADPHWHFFHCSREERHTKG